MLLLKRLYSNKKCNIGVLFINEIPNFITLELPFMNNQKNISCIPEGDYDCQKIITKKYGVTLEVLNVPNRTEILFHKGNFPRDTKGCILLGDSFSLTGDKILESSMAFISFQAWLRRDNNKKYKLRITYDI